MDLLKNEDIRTIAEIIFRIILCVILTGAIGFNREKKGMVVGIRTHVMVGLAGLLIQLTSLEYYRVNGGNNDVFRLAGQYISGIGFLGAGTILKDKRSVKGLTTAASICLVAIIGLSVGSGVYITSVLITIIAYIFLTDLFKLKKTISVSKSANTTIGVEVSEKIYVSTEIIKDIIRGFGADILSIEVNKEANKKTRMQFKIYLDDEMDINDLLSEIASIKEVDKTDLIEKLE